METIKEVQKLNCPMCEEGVMEYENIKGIHTYTCEMCPFQGIEGIDYTIEYLIENTVKKEK